MGSSNFLQFDPAGTGMLSDSAYSTVQQRLTGVVPGLASPTLHNKGFYQWSTMTYAWGQVLADAGYTVTDNNSGGLISSIKSLIGIPAPILHHHGSAKPVWLTGTTVSFAYIIEPDSTGTFVIYNNAATLFNAATVGLNGLDTGVLQTNTFYYPYAVSDGQSGSGHNGVMFSTVNAAAGVSTPSHSNFNYTYYRQLPGWVKTNPSSQIYRFAAMNWPYEPFFKYVGVAMPDYNNSQGSSPNTLILQQGTSGSWADVNSNAWLPPICTVGWYKFMGRNFSNNIQIFIRTKGDTSDGTGFSDNTTSGVSASIINTCDFIQTDSSQAIQYSTGSGGQVTIAVGGGIVTAEM